MSILLLQPFGIDPYPHREDAYELEGITIAIEIRWSERLQRWYATFRDEQGDVIFATRAVNAGYALLIRNRDARLPPGVFIPTALDRNPTAPGFEELGGRVVLRYIEAAEFPVLRLETDAVAAEVV